MNNFCNIVFVGLASAMISGAASAEVLKNGAEFSMCGAPEELTAQVKPGGSVRFLLEENGTTGYQWEATYSTNECAVVLEHREPDTSNGMCGAPGKVAVTVTKKPNVRSPSLVELVYRRCWEKDKPAKCIRLVVSTIPGEAVDGRTSSEASSDSQNRLR